MKRKKPPIALISVLVVSILGLVIAGKAFSFYNLSMEDQQRQLQQEAADRAMAQPKVQPTDQKNDTSQAMKDIKSKLQVGTPQVASTADKADARAFKTAVPTVVMPDEVSRKPVANPSAPTGQWYSKK